MNAQLFAECLNVARKVKRSIIGRCADNLYHMAYVAALNVLAGNGNYLEIGTLFGGTAITVAVMRRNHAIQGAVMCLDPLNGYYRGVRDDSGKLLDRALDICGIAPSVEIVQKNARIFNVSLVIVPELSQPWPAALKQKRFAVSYIDGNHWQGWPLRDWIEVEKRTSSFVVFDNCDDAHPSVQDAVRKALHNPAWAMYYQDHIQVVLERSHATT